MVALVDNLVIEQGTTWSYSVGVFTDVEVDETWIVRGQIRERIGCKDVLHEWSSALGTAAVGTMIYDGSEIPTVTLTVSAPVSSAWDWTRGFYDVEIHAVDESIVIRLLSGAVRVVPEVTR